MTTTQEALRSILVDPDSVSPNGHGDLRTNAWSRQDLTDVLSPDFQPARPVLGFRENLDGSSSALFYPALHHTLFGGFGSCKTWLSCLLCADELKQGYPALYIDVEASRQQVVPRLVALGVDRDVIREKFWYVHPTIAAIHGFIAEGIAADFAAAAGRLAILDATSELMALHGLKINYAEDVAALNGLLARPLTEAGITVVSLDHVPLDTSNGMRAVGSQHKAAGVDVALGMEQVRPFGRGMSGESRLVLQKDREGHLAGLTYAKNEIARISLDSFPDSGVSIHVRQGAGEAGTDDQGAKVEAAAERLVAEAKKLGRPATWSELYGRVKGDRSTVTAAHDYTIREGALTSVKEGRSLSIEYAKELPT